MTAAKKAGAEGAEEFMKKHQEEQARILDNTDFLPRMRNLQRSRYRRWKPRLKQLRLRAKPATSKSPAAIIVRPRFNEDARQPSFAQHFPNS